jgi:hypothetical protein
MGISHYGKQKTVSFASMRLNLFRGRKARWISGTASSGKVAVALHLNQIFRNFGAGWRGKT